MIANVLIDLKAKAVDKLFSYNVPQDLESIIEVGERIYVPFGSIKRMGYVISIEDGKSEELKDVIEIIDIEPIITKELIELAIYLSKTSSYPFVSYIETMIPKALKISYKKYIRKLDEGLNNLFNGKDLIDLDNTDLDLKDVKKYIKEGKVELVYSFKSQDPIKKERYITLINKNIKLTEKRAQVVNYLEISGGTESYSKLKEDFKLSFDFIKRMEEKGIISIKEEEIYRKIETIKPLFDKRVSLNESQTKVLNELKDNLSSSETFLLYGVTGSGKTEIYINLIEEAIKLNKDVILLVPEISLTPQMVNRFLSRFKENVAIFHSGLSEALRYDEWRKILRGEVKIVVGARSAIFAPFKNLGLIIIDEEHEQTYKQDDFPKYLTHDVASFRSKKNNALLLLGSATPSIESFARAYKGNYHLLELKERANKMSLPKTVVVDMNKEFKGGTKSIISKTLDYYIKERLKNHEKIILLLNRRGYSNFVLCRECGHVIECPNCSVSLNYHDYDNTLKCHYCGYEEKFNGICPKCGSKYIRKMGIGTEQVEEVLHTNYPEARIIRMDNDTTRKKGNHERLLYEFETNGDILLGTQMIAKGLDFADVTLVGILCADLSLKIPDFRAKEKTFQLITQVSGRAGRGDKEGLVVIQTYNKDHYAIKHAINQDYDSFFNQEMKIRKLAKYIPFYNITQIEFRHQDYAKCFLYAEEVKLKLKKMFDKEEVIILGPVSPVVRRVNDKFIVRILVKYKVLPKLDETLKELYTEYTDKDVLISIDRFPTSY